MRTAEAIAFPKWAKVNDAVPTRDYGSEKYAIEVFGEKKYAPPIGVFFEDHYMKVFFSNETMGRIDLLFKFIENQAHLGRGKTSMERVIYRLKKKYAKIQAGIDLATEHFEQGVQPDMWNAFMKTYRKSLSIEIERLLKGAPCEYGDINAVIAIVRYEVGYHLGDVEGD